MKQITKKIFDPAEEVRIILAKLIELGATENHRTVDPTDPTIAESLRVDVLLEEGYTMEKEENTEEEFPLREIVTVHATNCCYGVNIKITTSVKVEVGYFDWDTKKWGNYSSNLFVVLHDIVLYGQRPNGIHLELEECY